MVPDRLILEWIDISNAFLRSGSWVKSGVSAVALASAMQNASNAILTYETQGAPIIGAGTPAGAQYQLAQDAAVLNFQTIPGTTVQLLVPAPLAVVFGPNSTIVDVTNGLVSSIISNAIGTLADAGNNAATAYAGGSKVSRRTEQL